ncbi:MAG TPA: hypothetical protein DEA08_38200 [Planctomycetes bacterium]|nr:hypothetical protein [Planctomycetota bacterium]
MNAQIPSMKTDPVGHARDPQEMVTESLEFLSQVTRYNRWMADTLDPHVGQRVLEFGCGTGNMLSHFLDRERVAGIDLDPALIRYCEESFAGEENCEFHCADIFRDEVELSVQPDTVISLNVIEHIEDDRGALRWLVERLPVGGRLVILVPSHPTIYGELDRAAGHFRRYTKRELVSKVADSGCRVTHTRFFNAIGFFGWGLNSRLLKRRDIPSKQALFYDRFVVPLQARAERLIRPLFGQSLIVVGEKA